MGTKRGGAGEGCGVPMGGRIGVPGEGWGCRGRAEGAREGMRVPGKRGAGSGSRSGAGSRARPRRRTRVPPRPGPPRGRWLCPPAAA